MYNENLNNRVFEKLEHALPIYEQLVYNCVGELEHTEALFTSEHLRAVPETGFAPIEKGTAWGGEWNNMWLKGEFTVPAELDGKALYARNARRTKAVCDLCLRRQRNAVLFERCAEGHF